MKPFMLMFLVLALCAGVFTGCRRTAQEPTETTPVTTQPAPSTKPGMDDMLPGREDQIDPTNGANKPDASEPDMMEPEITDPTGMTTETVPEDANTRVRPRGRLLPGR